MRLTGKKCPWCGAGLNLFQLLMEATPWDRHEISYEKYFPCPRCKKPIVRRNNNSIAKKASRRTAVVFIVPLIAGFFIHRFWSVTGKTLLLSMLFLTSLCYLAFDLLVFYEAAELEKEEKLP